MQTSLLLHAFARRGTPLTFSELAAALEGTGASLSELVAALCRCQAEDTVIACGFADTDPARPGHLGPRLLELSEHGRDVVAADRSAFR
jgi:DNA-binding IclR family transcriptional regulator